MNLRTPTPACRSISGSISPHTNQELWWAWLSSQSAGCYRTRATQVSTAGEKGVGGGGAKSGRVLPKQHHSFFPNLAGPLSFSGEVQVSFPSEGAVDLIYHLEKLQPECRTPKPDTPNSCGIHIHEGKTCDDASLVGGHYYEGNTDPWANVVYTADANGEAWAKAGEVIVPFGNPDKYLESPRITLYTLADPN